MALRGAAVAASTLVVLHEQLCSGRAVRIRAAHRDQGRDLWAGLIVVALSVQWPTLKGFYYRAADVSPPLTSVQWRTDVAAALLDVASQVDA